MSLIDDFLYIEKKYKLNSIKIDGFTPWVYTRITVYRNILEWKKEPTTKGIKHHISLLHKRFIHIIKTLVRRNHPPKNIDVLFISSSLRVLCDNVYECKYTDVLAEIFTNSVTLEHSYSFSHFTPAKTRNLLYSDKTDLMSRLHKYFWTMTRHFPRSRFKIIQTQMITLFYQAISELADIIGADINIIKWATDTTKKFFYYKAAYRRFDDFLKATAPRLVVEVFYYDMRNMIINEIAKKMNIPTIELQHGLVGSGHIVYNYPQGETIAQCADKLFLFGEYWKTQISFPLDSDSIIAVGFPYYEKQKDICKDRQEPERKNILFLSQPTLSPLCDFDKIAVDALARLSDERWRVTYKLHPGEYNDWVQRYPSLVNSKVEVVGEQCHLYELFTMSTAIVGIASTALFEGIGFDLPIFVVNTPDLSCIEEIDSLCENGYAQKFYNVDDLCTKLNNLNNTSVSDSGKFWKSDALNNIITEMKGLLKSEQ